MSFRKAIIFLDLELSYIIGKAYPITSKTYSLKYLQGATGEELEYYLYKAKKLQKTGRTLNIVGASILGTSVFILVAFGENMGMEGILFGWSGLAGVTTMAVGLPLNLTGKVRVERINSIKNNALNNIKINLQPCAVYNLMTRNYQPGVSLNVRF